MKDKYDCMDTLNGLNAKDDAVQECLIQDDGLSRRKETRICHTVKAIEILQLNYSEPVKKGADYCYFKYPWADQAREKYECLMDEGVPKEYLSSFCIENHKYMKEL